MTRGGLPYVQNPLQRRTRVTVSITVLDADYLQRNHLRPTDVLSQRIKQLRENENRRLLAEEKPDVATAPAA